jgi:spore coat polysaccharide biosynthesis protein SpsF
MDLAGRPSLVQLIDRLRQSQYLNNIVIATTTNQEDDIVAQTAAQNNVLHYRGSEEDVLLRTVEAAEAYDTEIIVQVTSDCPLIDSETIDAAIARMLEHPYLDYVGNHLVRTYPLGFSVEVFRTGTLRQVEQTTQDPADREHVSLYLYEHPEMFNLSNIEAPHYLRHPEYRLTLDTKEDYLLIKKIYEDLYPKKQCFTLYDIVKYLNNHPDLLSINKNIIQKKAR